MNKSIEMSGNLCKNHLQFDIIVYLQQWDSLAASSMVSSGKAGKININGSTYELVKNKFNCTHRGKIQAKNKGEIDMYFVDQ